MSVHGLPDLFRFDNGSRVTDPAGWKRRRAEIAAAIMPIEYGELPPASPPQALEIRRSANGLIGGAESRHYLISIGSGPRFAFSLEVHLPPGGEKKPAIISGDGCWPLDDQIPREVLGRGAILAQFDRTMIMPDAADTADTRGLRRVFPGDYGALAAWAWGYHRVIDILLALPEVDPARIAVMGHSRGGKAALLAGATDERIAVTCANQSGCGGAGCFRWLGEKSETLGDILAQFPHWFASGLKDFIGREHELPFDQHSLKALIAPRALLTTEALGDPWANPEGTWQTHRAAREVYRFLGTEEKLGIRFRSGPHDQTPLDWQALLDFMEFVFAGRKLDRSFTESPFHLSLAHRWAAPNSRESSAS